MNKIVLEKIKNLLLNTFTKAEVEGSIAKLKIGDIEEWDSQGNLNLLLAIEEEFNIRFSMEEMSELKSIKQIILAIERQI